MQWENTFRAENAFQLMQDVFIDGQIEVTSKQLNSFCPIFCIAQKFLSPFSFKYFVYIKYNLSLEKVFY